MIALVAVLAYIAALVAVAASFLVLRRKLNRLTALLREQHAQLAAVVWETANVRGLARGEGTLPRAGGWAASPDALAELARRIARGRPALVLELGSGTSTGVIALALKLNGAGRLVSLEHDAGFAGETQRDLERLGLEGWVDLRVAPLVASRGGTPWYDPALLAGVRDVDLAFVDGPPADLVKESRSPTLEHLWERLRPGGTVLFDDAARPAERELIRSWIERRTDARVEWLDLEKGAAAVTRGS